MSTKQTHRESIATSETARRHLRVIAEADAGSIARILQPFQSLNIVPQQVRVDRIGCDYVEIAVQVLSTDIDLDSFATLIAKLAQAPSVLTAVASDW